MKVLSMKKIMDKIYGLLDTNWDWEVIPVIVLTTIIVVCIVTLIIRSY